MLEGKSVLALVPARAGSKGLPGKNIRVLCGKPLIQWPIISALGANAVDRVIVSTDDPAIAACARAAGAEVPFMRPPELATDTASSMDVVRHALAEVMAAGQRYDYLVLLEPTSPLTESADIQRALSTLHRARERADAIVGVSRIEAAHPEYAVRRTQLGLLRPYNAPDFGSLRRRQEIEELHFLEGSLYITAVDSFLRKGTFYHERTMGYEVPRWKSFEIDEWVDFVCVEALMQRRDEFRCDNTHPATESGGSGA